MRAISCFNPFFWGRTLLAGLAFIVGRVIVVAGRLMVVTGRRVVLTLGRDIVLERLVIVEEVAGRPIVIGLEVDCCVDIGRVPCELCAGLGLPLNWLVLIIGCPLVTVCDIVARGLLPWKYP